MSEHANTTTTTTTTTTPTAGPEDKSTGIRAAMSVSNLLTPPSQGSDVPGPSTPVAASRVGPAATPGASSDATASSPAAADGDDTKMDLDASSPATDEDQTSAPVVREFICKNDEFAECKTGQYTMDLSRKVISDHFGRNKACTRIIKNWPLFCRKHYQRATYNQEKWQLRKVALIIRQFYIIEEQFPGTMYTVALKKSEENRLNTFSRKVASGMEPEEASKYVEPRENKHFEAPIDVLRELSMDLGSNKNVTEVDQIVNNIHDMLVNHETKQVPSIEFLPQLDADGTPYVEDDGSSPSKGKSPKKPRVNKKGGIQKPATPKKASKA